MINNWWKILKHLWNIDLVNILKKEKKNEIPGF